MSSLLSLFYSHFSCLSCSLGVITPYPQLRVGELGVEKIKLSNLEIHYPQSLIYVIKITSSSRHCIFVFYPTVVRLPFLLFTLNFYITIPRAPEIVNLYVSSVLLTFCDKMSNNKGTYPCISTGKSLLFSPSITQEKTLTHFSL
jgi:hypothetical protein